MNLKKVLAAVTAAAVTAASVSVSSFATLLPLKTYQVEADISGYTTEQLENFPVKTLIENLRYSMDYTIEVSEKNSGNEAEGELYGAPASTAEAQNPTAETQNPTAEAQNPTAETQNPTAEAQNSTAEASTEESGTKTITYHRGDPVQLAEDAVKVLVNGSEYSIVDAGSTVDLSKIRSYDKITLIVGSGKQLDPANVAYIISLNINKTTYDPVFEARFYTLDENGEKSYIGISGTNQSMYSSGKACSFNSYADRPILVDEKIYMEIEGSVTRSDTSENVESDFKYDFNSSSETPNLLFRIGSYSGNSKDDDASYNYGALWYKDIDAEYTYTRSDGQLMTASCKIYVYLYGESIDMYGDCRADSNYIVSDYMVSNIASSKGVLEQRFDYGLDPGYKDEDYVFILTSVYAYPANQSVAAYIKKAVVGRFDSLEAASGEADIKDELLNSGYKAEYSKGVEFTLFLDGSCVPDLVDRDGESYSDYVIHLGVTTKLTPAEDDSSSDGKTIVDLTNAYFRVIRVKNTTNYMLVNKKSSAVNSTSEYLDSYYMYNYQTVFIYDKDSSYDMGTVMLDVLSPDNIKVYDSVAGKLVKFDEEPQDLSGGPKQYTVAASANQGNYTVHAVKNTTGGAKLFVNGPAEREIFLDSAYGMAHDILVANIGDEELTGLSVELTDAQNVKLDGYWNIGGEKNDSLAPFTGLSRSSYKVDGMSNLAKIRLVPDGEGEVSGKLTVSANGQEPYTITLKGHAGNPKIVTEPELTEGVKYVPYYAVIATDNIHDWNTVTFRLSGGRLPKGVSLNSRTGELYGVPQEAGTYTFSVQARFSDGAFDPSYQNFTLNVLDNTDTNVYEATDADYDLLTPIGTEQNAGKHDYGLPRIQGDQLFVSNGTYGEFQALWINGEKMTPDVDYTSESGSTRITIRSQTLNNKLSTGKGNTIAAEFRASDTNEVRRTAQNVYINVKGGNNGGNSGGGNSGGSSGGSAGGTGTTVKPDLTPGFLDGSAKGWDGIKSRISGMTSGALTISMNGSSLLPADVTALIKGKDITLNLMSDDGTFSVNGRTVTNAENTGVEIKRGTSIPEAPVLSGGISRSAFSIGNSGAFGYKAAAKLSLGAANAGMIANICKAVDGKIRCTAAVKIDNGGFISYSFSEGGDYFIVVDHISRLAGDANGDLVVNSLDSSAILKHVTGIVVLDSAREAYCDINGDGRVNALDAAAVLRNSIR